MENLGDLLEGTRIILDDTVCPGYLHSNEYLTRLLNEATTEAAIRTRVIQDSTSSFTSVQLTAGRSHYSVNKSVFAIRRVRLVGEREPLELRDVRELDCLLPGWDDPDLVPPSAPRYACFDLAMMTMVIVPAPQVDVVAKTLVWRGPTDDELMLEGDRTSEPAVPHHMRRGLVHWAASQASLNQDAETRNTTLAQEQLALFEAEYGPRPSLEAMRLWSTNRRKHVRAHFD